MRMLKTAAISAAAIATISLSACGGGATTSAAPAPPMAASAAPSMAPAGSAPAMDGQFGPGCAAVPKDASNPGSFAAMAKVPVATAASGNPVLSTLVSAVKKANLVDSLNSV